MELKERRDNLKKREQQIDKVITETDIDLDKILNEISEEREERNEFDLRRVQIRRDLEDEIHADKSNEGERDEAWEEWANDKREELADLIEASESRLDRLIERVVSKEDHLKELKKRDKKLEKRIDRISKKLATIQTNSAGQLTKSFHIAEFHCRDGTKVPSAMIPHIKELCVLHLQPLRDSGGTVTINSGYRTRAYNAAIGGASASYHIYDLRMKAPAADHVQSGRSANSVQQWHERSSHPFDGMGFYSGFTHGDDRGYRSRWYGAS